MTGKRFAVHMVSAWANRAGLTLGQVKVNDKSNEITAIPELLDLLELQGCIVTIDAMGTQKAIAQRICEKEADYLLAPPLIIIKRWIKTMAVLRSVNVGSPMRSIGFR